ncbi:hypothetical protein HG531_001188 [Fusarium graminearum]|nr:hypothetical protein HG531_001188 [Fusarium graminearum]
MREQWADRFSNLEVNGTVLDLHNDVVVKLSVKLAEELYSGIRTVGFPVSPVELVINESSEHDNSSVRLEGFGKHVGTIRQCALSVVLESTVKGATLILTDNLDRVVGSAEPVSILFQFGMLLLIVACLLKVIHSSDDNSLGEIASLFAVGGLQVDIENTAEALLKLRRGTS